ncbi:MAG TPA: hypothetical protein VK773_14150 [Acidimicrobiales bacterium]|jgi:hypothetical protein|nr:hypothetical protein [Acidimicrobiales bacterium]
MSPETKSKAQRRAAAQQRAAEQRAAELRRKRTRMAVRIGGVVAVLVLVIVLIVVLSGGSTGTPPVFTNPHVAGLEPIPASMKDSWVQPPVGKPGPEVVPLTTGPKLATLVNAATGQTVDGVQCNAGEKTVAHVHTHLTIFVNGQSRVIPYGVGIPGFQAEATNPPAPAGPGPFVVTGTCFYWLHVHTLDGIVHIESPSKTQGFTLGQFFDEWGVPLSTTQVGPATGKVTVFFTSPGKSPKLYTGDPRNLPLGDHYQIQLVVGTPIVAPVQVTNWGGL